jgi:hypothetical protein
MNPSPDKEMSATNSQIPENVIHEGDRVLTDKAQKDRDDFHNKYDEGNCSCHINPPCNSCIHPGNPINQEEDDECFV